MTPNYPYSLPLGRYRELMAADYAALHSLAERALAAEVPTCPGWNGEKLARHTAMVYLQKAETIRTGKKPSGHWLPEEYLKRNALQLLAAGYAQVIEQFETHDPTDVAESWVPDDQTVGFWIRRLTHETSIHRRDMESALGRLTPVETDLAIDGIDEVLTVMLGRGGPEDSATSCTVDIESGTKVWSVTLNPAAAAVSWESSPAPAGRIAGDPSDVLLYLWGRAPLPPDSTGATAAAELRSRLATST